MVRKLLGNEGTGTMGAMPGVCRVMCLVVALGGGGPLLLLAGCAARGPELGIRPQRVAGEARATPGARVTGRRLEVARAGGERAYRSTTIPGGLACLIRLRELGVPHRHRGPVAGVVTPVEVTGPIDGVRLARLAGRPLLCDCRLALALHRAAPTFRAMGVETLHFSSAYRRGRRPGGKLSRHAMGLALDVHRLTVRGEVLSLEAHYEAGLDPQDRCASDAPLLNRLACALKARGLFDRVLTPDTDRAHRNHYHLAILSLHRRRFPPRDTPPEAVAD